MDENSEIEAIEGGGSVRFERERDIAVVEAWGEIDLSGIPQFNAVLDEALEAEVAVIVDLGRVTYMDSSGFNALLETSRTGKSLGVIVFLANCNSNIARLLEVTRLNRLFEIAPDVETARATAVALIAPQPATV